MPLYEYLCEKCHQEVEVLVRGCDPQPECPLCGGQELKKLLSVVAAPSGGGSTDPAPRAGGGGCGAGCGCH